ncbi:MAG TPA: nuclear transport factor 2 family protein [Terriglobales bacterium]|nr:nuclear transport factor 2 family protein [Terriglobales bacterium]
MKPQNSDLEQIQILLKSINDAWLKGRPEDVPQALTPHFHPDICIKGPGLQMMAKGRDACARSYQEFLQQATLKDCALSEPEVSVYGDTAVATFKWEMTYVLQGQEYRESGYDLFVLCRADGRWLACWRAMLPAPSQ